MKRIGVIGGGQLAGMMAAAAQKLGVQLVVQTPQMTDPAAAIAAQVVLAQVDDAIATAQLAAQCDVITFENEFVDLAALAPLAQSSVCFRPSLDALQPLLDKYDQRQLMQRLGFLVPAFTAYDARSPLDQVALTFPVVLKTRRHGYDGQGTCIVKTAAALKAALDRFADVPLLIEQFVPFERELAVMAARSVTGDVVVYPVVETQQHDQVCRWAIAPAAVSETVSRQIEAIAQTLLTQLQIVGIVGIELFLTADDKVWVNEIAPRTHNSGHYTLDACETSQFEQQLRAVCGLALGSPGLKTAAAVMVNLLGFESAISTYDAQRARLAAFPQAHLHWYGKAESRPGRKLGHVTVLLEQDDRAAAIAIAQHIETLWYPQ